MALAVYPTLQPRRPPRARQVMNTCRRRRSGDIKEHIANTRDKSEDHIVDNFSSDLDDPYHETAKSWLHRDILRRIRRSAGVSSEEESSTGSEDVRDCEHDDLSSGKEFSILSATRKFDAWLDAYPVIASKCCLSAATKSTAVEEETQRLKRILRRLRRKEKEFRFKHTEMRTCSSYHQKTNSIPAEAMQQIHTESSSEKENDKLAIQSFLPQGTGLAFVDSILARADSKNDEDNEQSCNWPILELNAPPRSGATSTLVAVAARYVACTSSLFFSQNGHMHVGECDDGGRAFKRRRLVLDEMNPNEPSVVLLDVEKSCNIAKLVCAVKEATFRRWDETSNARQWMSDQEVKWRRNLVRPFTKESTQVDADDFASKDDTEIIERIVASCLGRIHVVQPRDFNYLSLVATIEVLRQSLDDRRESKSAPTGQPGETQESFDASKLKSSKQSIPTKQAYSSEAPTMILIDSLSTLDASTRYQESFSTGGSGLSNRNEFFRQLARLRESHQVVIVGASRANSSSRPKDHQWDKMVTHRVAIQNVAQGTKETQMVSAALV